jgi:hypothetical protein
MLYERSAWVRCYWIPLHAWNIFFFFLMMLRWYMEDCLMLKEVIWCARLRWKRLNRLSGIAIVLKVLAQME